MGLIRWRFAVRAMVRLLARQASAGRRLSSPQRHEVDDFLNPAVAAHPKPPLAFALRGLGNDRETAKPGTRADDERRRQSSPSSLGSPRVHEDLLEQHIPVSVWVARRLPRFATEGRTRHRNSLRWATTT